MPSNITREYLRGRLAIVLIGVALAVMAGSGFILLKAEQEKTKVKFGTVIGYLAEVTNDLLYRTAQLESASRSLAEQRAIKTGITDHAHPEVTTATDIRIAEREAEIFSSKASLNEVLERLIHTYRALEWSADGDIRMNESQRITRGEDVSPFGGATPGSTVTQPIAALQMPEAVRLIWDGNGHKSPLKSDLREVISQANRLDIFADYSTPSARRVFSELRNLAKTQVRPGLARALDELHKDMIASYGGLQFFMIVACASIVGVSLAIGVFVFRPMVQNRDRGAFGAEKRQQACRGGTKSGRGSRPGEE